MTPPKTNVSLIKYTQKSEEYEQIRMQSHRYGGKDFTHILYFHDDFFTHGGIQ